MYKFTDFSYIYTQVLKILKVEVMNQFEKMGIDDDFNAFYAEQGIKEPTEVQKSVIPKILDDKSVMCVAQTGTGKTLTYALPLSELVKKIEDEEGLTSRKSSPYVIVTAPTKELASQIHSVFKDLSHHVKLRVRTMLGGGKGGATKSLKTQSYEILIATPTRLARSIKSGEVSLNQIKHVVFDEADQLFDMGFKKDIDTILYPLKYDETAIHFFSATMSDSIDEYMVKKFRAKEITKVNLLSAQTVQQKIDTFNIFVSPKEKNMMLKLFIQKTAVGRGIVFINQKNQVEEVEAYIKEQLPKIKYRVLHGGLTQKERLDNHKAFSEKKAQILLATDVAARGIDIKDLAWVFNWGLPKSAEYYLHRAGRTGRAGQSGAVYNLVTSFDAKLISFINEAIKKQSRLNLDFIAKDIKDVRKKTANKNKATKTKTKRLKVTKRTR